MEINGKAKISISTAAGAELELGSAMQVDVNTSGVMSVEGPLSYVLTTFP
jgi:hypothetical protein